MRTLEESNDFSLIGIIDDSSVDMRESITLVRGREVITSVSIDIINLLKPDVVIDFSNIYTAKRVIINCVLFSGTKFLIGTEDIKQEFIEYAQERAELKRTGGVILSDEEGFLSENDENFARSILNAAKKVATLNKVMVGLENLNSPETPPKSQAESS